MTQSGCFGVSDAEYERSVKSDQNLHEILKFSEMEFPGEIYTPGDSKFFAIFSAFACNKFYPFSLNQLHCLLFPKYIYQIDYFLFVIILIVYVYYKST